MKFRGTKLSTRTLALFAAALILLVSSGVAGTKAAITVTSDDYDATIATNEIDISLTEQLDGARKATVLENKGTFTLTKDKTLTIGKNYKDSIGVKNSGTADEYVRVIVRKYWIEKDQTKKTDVTLKLKPEWIELKEAKGWKKVKGENNEYAVYYLKQPLKVDESKELFTGFRIDSKVKTAGKKIMIGEKEYASDAAAEKAAKDGDVITYTYTYDGCTFCVEAEAQSIQTHHYKDAMKSVWGVNASDVL